MFTVNQAAITQVPSMPKLWLKLERAFLYYSVRLFRIRDASELVARGFALGVIVNFFPTFGFGVVLSGFVARLLGGNMIAGFVGGATLTFFWPFLFYLNMLVGGWVLTALLMLDPALVEGARAAALLWGTAFMIGALVNSLIIGATLYVFMQSVFRAYRESGLSALHRSLRRHQGRAPAPNRPVSAKSI
jgi:uncharacterized protein (DUF2062 family)